MMNKNFNLKKRSFKKDFASTKDTIPSEEDSEPPPVFPVLEEAEHFSRVSVDEDSEPPGITVISKQNIHTGLEVVDYIPSILLRAFGKDLRTLKNRARGTVTESLRSRVFCNEFFPRTGVSEWSDWRWQLRNRIVDLNSVERILNLSPDERCAIASHNGTLPLAVTPYYASLLDRNDPMQPLRRTVVPVTAENILSLGESIDPLGEDGDSPVPGIVHRYPDRALFLVTSFCSVNCRYCTRSRIVGGIGRYHLGRKEWEGAISYIAQNTEIRDVLLSGGDPLTLSNDQLEYLLRRLHRISHVEIIRLGTKVPVVLPQRITLSLVKLLKKYHPLWMSIHFTHPDELTPEVGEACGRLANAGIPLGSQTVLLKGINDDVETMKRLVHGLMKFRVRPYYLYQCDPIQGSSHFRTPVEKGIEIIRGLRGHTSGYAVPHYVIDAPGGGGKILICPDSIVGKDGDYLVLKNYEGLFFRYPDQGGKETYE